MANILVCTVGGACAPVVTAIRDYAPTFTCFFATTGTRGSRVTVDGARYPCGEGKPNIVTQTQLAEGTFEIVELDEPDSLPDCYSTMRSVLGKLVDAHPGLRYVADYTGGTKTMGAALVLTALELNWELSLVRGTRADLVRVLDGSEMASLVNAGEVRARQVLNEAERLFDARAYGSAESVIEGIARSIPLSNELLRQVNQMVALCRTFDAWDRFDHAKAKQLLEPYQSFCVPQWRFLKNLTGERATGYETVMDLVRNAERRASRGRYDDAVARLYRALELLAQIRLRQRTPPLDAGDLLIQALPEKLRAKYEALRDSRTKRIRIGLRQDYELLAALDDPIGICYREFANRILNGLSSRNNSILAHGVVPLSKSDYDAMASLTTDFIGAGLAALEIRIDAPQFPHWGDLTR